MTLRVDPIGLTALILLAILLGFVIDDHVKKPEPVPHMSVTETPMKPPDVKWDSNFQWDQDSVWRDDIRCEDTGDLSVECRERK